VISDIIKDRACLLLTDRHACALEHRVATRRRFAPSRLVLIAFTVSFCAQLPANAQTKTGSIHDAAERGDLAAVTKIVTQNRGSVRALDSYHETPLHFAAKNGRRDVAEYLLLQGADPNAKNNAGETPLYAASLIGYVSVVELLLTHGADVSLGNSVGPPINTAAGMGNADVVRLLLDYGALVNSKDTLEGSTPLQAAIIPKLRPEMLRPTVELLLARGADLEAKNKKGQTALHIAAWGSTSQAVEFLLSKGANVRTKDLAGQTPLHAVAEKPWHSKQEIVALLLAKRPDGNAKNSAGYTPLHVLAKMRLGLTAEEVRSNAHSSAAEARRLLQDQAEAARLLIAGGAIVDSRDDGDCTPLHWAAWSNSGALVELLLRSGADKSARDNVGRTPLHKAAEEGSLEVAERLVRERANLATRDKFGHTPLGSALRYRKQTVADYLQAHGATE
jgi:ankyrin repeat protein